MSFNCNRAGVKKSRYPNYICNPESERWVKIGSEEGLKSVDKVKATPRDCRATNAKSGQENYVCNPATSRWVKAGGRVGKIVEKYYGKGKAGQIPIKKKKLTTVEPQTETVAPTKLTGKAALLALKKNKTGSVGTPILPPGYQFVRRLGSGLSGDLYLAHPEGKSTNVVIKQYRDPINAKTAQAMTDLVNSMKKVNDEYLLSYFDSYYDASTGEFYIVMDYFDGHSLSDQDLKTATQDDKLQWILQAIVGLDNLHTDFQLSHQDLKPSSLMISNDLNQLRYIGYGLVADLATWKKNFNMTSGAPYYRSPENIVATGNVNMEQMANLTKATDIWALGLIIYYILTRKHAFQTDFQDSVQAINYTILGTEPDYQKLPADFRNNASFMKMLKGMLIKDPLQRMKIAEVEDLYEQAFREISA